MGRRQSWRLRDTVDVLNATESGGDWKQVTSRQVTLAPVKTFLEKKEVHTDKQDGWGCRPGQTPGPEPPSAPACGPWRERHRDPRAALPPRPRVFRMEAGALSSLLTWPRGPRRSPTCREGPEYVRENRADGGVSERTLSSSRPFHAYLSYLRFPRDPQHTAVPLFYDS